MSDENTDQLRPGDSDVELLRVSLHLLVGDVHRRDVHVGDVDGHLGDVPLRQPPADALHRLQSAGLVFTAPLLPDVERNSEKYLSS